MQMIEVKKNERPQIAHLFKGIEDSMVIAYLQGYMGRAFADKLPDPGVSIIISGEYSFFAGDPTSAAAKELARTVFAYVEEDATVAIYAEDNLQWRDLLLSVPENHPKEVARYGIVQKDYEFDRNRLQQFIEGLPEGFELKRFDEDLYQQAMGEDWSKEFCETFDSAEDYLKKGFGFGAVYRGKLVAGASTMTVYDGGTEVQVATKEEFQRRGLAMPCAAALLLECMKRKIRPCWDAANLISKHMALQLGYEYKGEYSTVHMHR